MTRIHSSIFYVFSPVLLFTCSTFSALLSVEALAKTDGALFFLDSQQEIAIIGWLLTEKEEDAIVFEDFPAVYKPAVSLRMLFKKKKTLVLRSPP